MQNHESAIDEMLSGDGVDSESTGEMDWNDNEDNFTPDFEGWNDETSDLEAFAYEDAEWSDDESTDYEFDDFETESEFSEYESEGNWDDPATSGLLTDAEVDLLAREYAGLATPLEMEAFLGKVFGSISKKARGALKSTLGQKIMRTGSSLLGRALPVVGSALGTAVLPGVGSSLGGTLGGQLKNLFSRRGRQTIGRRLTRRALSSARRAGRRNPLPGLLNRDGGQMVRSMFGFEMESTLEDPRLEVARRVVQTVADAADEVSRNGLDSEAAVFDAFRRASERNIPPAIRASLIAGPMAE